MTLYSMTSNKWTFAHIHLVMCRIYPNYHVFILSHWIYIDTFFSYDRSIISICFFFIYSNLALIFVCWTQLIFVAFISSIQFPISTLSVLFFRFKLSIKNFPFDIVFPMRFYVIVVMYIGHYNIQHFVYSNDFCCTTHNTLIVSIICFILCAGW